MTRVRERRKIDVRAKWPGRQTSDYAREITQGRETNPPGGERMCTRSRWSGWVRLPSGRRVHVCGGERPDGKTLAMLDDLADLLEAAKVRSPPSPKKVR